MIDLIPIKDLYGFSSIARYCPTPICDNDLKPCFVYQDNELLYTDICSDEYINIAQFSYKGSSVETIIKNWNRYIFDKIYDLCYKFNLFFMLLIFCLFLVPFFL